MRTFVIEKESLATFKAMDKIVDKKNWRKDLRHIHWDGKKFAATDGKRMIVASSEWAALQLGETEGKFDLKGTVLVEADVERGSYPDVARCIPRDEFLTAFQYPRHKEALKASDINFAVAVNVWLNSKDFYAAPELLQGMGGAADWTKIGTGAEGKAIRVDGKAAEMEVTFVIMPRGAWYDGEFGGYGRRGE